MALLPSICHSLGWKSPNYSNNGGSRKASRQSHLRILAIIYHWLTSEQEVCAVFFDMKKAFDSMPHRPLLKKLASIRLHHNILQWVRSYLTDRQQCVVVGNETSNDIPVLWGVPQGSVLGPLLFFLYIDDFTRVHLSTGSKLTLYTDDILLYKAVR